MIPEFEVLPFELENGTNEDVEDSYNLFIMSKKGTNFDKKSNVEISDEDLVNACNSWSNDSRQLISRSQPANCSSSNNNNSRYLNNNANINNKIASTPTFNNNSKTSNNKMSTPVYNNNSSRSGRG
jgi:hypothetical protein